MDPTDLAVSAGEGWTVWLWDILEANVGMPILVLRHSLSFYLLFLLFLTIVPGFLHVASGKVLRWPILFITYFQISVELVMYIILRLLIRLMEYIFQSGTHRRMRKEIFQGERVRRSENERGRQEEP